jgi:cytochrome b561
VPGVAAWQAATSRLVHWGLLIAILMMPLSGFLGALLGGRTISIYGLFEIAPLMESEALRSLAGFTHMLTAWTLAALITLHLAAALTHALIDKDQTLARMLTGKRASQPA